MFVNAYPEWQEVHVLLNISENNI